MDPKLRQSLPEAVKELSHARAQHASKRRETTESAADVIPTLRKEAKRNLAELDLSQCRHKYRNAFGRCKDCGRHPAPEGCHWMSGEPARPSWDKVDNEGFVYLFVGIAVLVLVYYYDMIQQSREHSAYMTNAACHRR